MHYIKNSLLIISISIFTSCESLPEDTYGTLKSIILNNDLDDATVANGLKEALAKGSQKAVAALSTPGGYGKNPLYKIIIPEELQGFSKNLKQVGLGKQVDFFEGKMNEAAEEVSKKAAPIFINAIKTMTLKDAEKILMGSNTAATEYFKEKSYASLTKEYLPIIKSKMEEIGIVADYNNLVKSYNALPFTSQLTFNPEQYITEQSLKGLFKMLENTEKEIRNNPATRTSAILKKVFAQQDNK